MVIKLTVEGLNIEINSIHDAFDYILKFGKSNRCNKWNGGRPLMQVINKKLPQMLKVALSEIDPDFENIQIIGRSGSSGVWSKIMYICLLDECSFCTGRYSTSYGVYPAFLISSDCRRIYLVYMLAIGSKREKELLRMCETIKELSNFDDFNTDLSLMDLVDDPHNYKLATLAYQEYSESYLPDNDTILKDLVKFIRLHQDVKNNAYPEALKYYRLGLNKKVTL